MGIFGTAPTHKSLKKNASLRPFVWSSYSLTHSSWKMHISSLWSLNRWSKSSWLDSGSDLQCWWLLACETKEALDQEEQDGATLFLGKIFQKHRVCSGYQHVTKYYLLDIQTLCGSVRLVFDVCMFFGGVQIKYWSSVLVFWISK